MHLLSWGFILLLQKIMAQLPGRSQRMFKVFINGFPSAFCSDMRGWHGWHASCSRTPMVFHVYICLLWSFCKNKFKYKIAPSPKQHSCFNVFFCCFNLDRVKLRLGPKHPKHPTIRSAGFFAKSARTKKPYWHRRIKNSTGLSVEGSSFCIAIWLFGLLLKYPQT